MSTILKALKQAEKSNPVQGDESRPSFNGQARFRFQAKQKKKRLFLNPGLIVSIVVLIILMAIFLYFIFPVNKTTKLKTPFATRQSQVLVIQPDNVKNDNQLFPAPVTESRILSETSTPIRPKPAGNSFDLSISQNKPALKPESANKLPVGDIYPSTAKEKIAQPFDTNFPKEIKKSSPLKTTPGEKPSSITRESVSPALEMDDPIKNKKERLTQDTPSREIITLENDDLKVQAISWAQEPKSRIAVIDNRVLRQGDSVQGYHLVKIEKDSVVLEYSGKNYRLGFNYR